MLKRALTVSIFAMGCSTPRWNPFAPKEPVFEAYAENQTPGAYRIFWCYGPDKKQITIIAITPHP